MTDPMPILEYETKVTPAANPARVWALRAIKFLLLAVVLFFVGRAIRRQLGDQTWRNAHFQVQYLGLAAGALAVASFVGVAIRRFLLAGFCEPPGWRDMAAISWVPMVGKYLPGKVFSVAGTVWMLKRHGVREPVAVSLVFIVNGLSMALGLALAIPLTFWTPVAQKIPFAWLIGAVVLAGFLVCLHPASFARVCNWLLVRFKRKPLEMVPRLRNYFEPMVLILVNWVLAGGTLWLIARSLNPVSVGYVPLFVATTALAATVGLMAFFAPAGLGVRDGIQLAILTVLIGAGTAAVVVVAMRTMQTLVELAFVGMGLLIRRPAEV